MENSELLNLEEFLPYRLSVLSNTVSRGISAAYVDRFGLSIREWRIIAVLGRYPGLSAAEIVKLTAMDKVAVSRAVTKLTGKGRLKRSLSAADKRRSVLVLSKEGIRLFDQISPLAKSYEERLLECLAREDQDKLSDILDNLQKQARALQPPD
ncbi:MAG: MarR family transcriptional regulator [Proteobacteria bacterium]|nr:MarR family transcriptional regulator [Pseudomonadota bacterium]MCH9027729.1 MarR family transcriptional regulator [Pseudomonadota bacterium]